ncbi:MAG: hypothetical protein MN733_37935 [Nitrososphaera sp.]|nr:hypothetical protein [Nitrososphaera sp.]
MKDERDEMEDWRKEKAEMEARLRNAQLKNLALEALIECVEEHYDIDVKKNFGGKASKNSKSGSES